MAALLARYVLVTVAVVILNFALPRFLPGDPLDPASPDGITAPVSTLTVDARTKLRAYYHLDQPLVGQFESYLGDLGRGDFGWSISMSAPVRQLIGERAPWTIALVLTSTIIAGCGGVLLGLAAAWRGGRLDRSILTLSTVFLAIPEFLVAMALLLALAVGLRWFPIPGGQPAFGAEPADLVGRLGALLDAARQLLLPALTLVLTTTAGFVLLTRGAAREVLSEPYLTTARAKGLGERQVALRHALPNALLPVLTLFGVRVGQVLGGAIVIERVFGVPGLGLFAFEAVRARDYPVLQAEFLLASLAVLAVNFAVEVAYHRLEPHRVA